MAEISRREAFSLFISSLLATTLPGKAFADGGGETTDAQHLTFGPPQAFTFDALKQRAAVMAREPWKDGKSPHGEILQRIDYDAFQAITFNKDDALWNDGKGGSPVQLFHLGRYFQEPVHIHVVEGGTAREILYRQSYFNMPADHPAHELPDDIGFSGFRMQEQSQEYDWLAFLGASYFRSSGSLNQYGLSARGLAVDTALQKPEEFPRFSEIWLERKEGINDRVIVYALLDSPSVTGAYYFDCSKAKGVTMDVECSLYPRKPIERLGIAPLTSMYWYSETVRRQAIDWRPEIHDSDGLAMWMGNGERLWRPLNNPLWTVTNAFLDENPRGFGLLQRDRNFDNYQDDGVFYDRRPSVWIEPRGNWGKGQIQLVEIPTDVEIHDNIVMYWVPDGVVEPGRTLDFSYRMFWDAEEPFPADLGRVVASYTGVGGIPGQDRPAGAVRFVVDFRGEKVENARRGQATPKITLSRGEVSVSDAYHVVGQSGLFRAFFDTVVEGSEPLDIRMYVESKDGTALTETWLYQYFPQPFS